MRNFLLDFARCFWLAPLLMYILGGVACGDVIIKFRQVGDTVEAMTSGSIVIPDETPLLAVSLATLVYADQYALNFREEGVFQQYSFGGNESIGPLLSPTTGVGDTFGFNRASILFGGGIAQGATFSPETTWTWTSTTLQDLGFDTLGPIPTTAYTAINGERIQFTVVPEASVLLLFLFGIVGIVFFRRWSSTFRKNSFDSKI